MKLEGTTLGGKYRVLRQIGAGGMGRVFEALHEQTERTVAVKVLSPEAAQQPDTLARFDREARAAGRIGHDNICEVIDVGFADGNVPYLVMPMLRGQSLAAVLRSGGPMPLRRCLDVATQILAALAAAHEAGVIHRDLKPDNVFLVRMGDREDFVKVLDFGISKMLHESRPDATLTQTGTILGTPYYMSPEQARGLKDLDARVDVYAMGAILYQMLTGKPPFDGDSYNQLLSSILLDEFPQPSVLRPETPPAVEDVILHATQKDRALRYRDAGEMRQALLAAVTGTSLKPADLLASSETLPGTPPSSGSGALAPVRTSASGVSSSPAGRASPSGAPVPGGWAPTEAFGTGPGGTPVPISGRAGAVLPAGGSGPDDLATGQTAVASGLSQSRMGQAVLAETAARPSRGRSASVIAVLAGAVAIVALAVWLARGGAGGQGGGGPAAGSSAETGPRGEAAATPTTTTASPAARVAPVPVPLVVPSPAAAGGGPAPDAGAPAAEVVEDAVEASPEVRIELRGVPRGALVRVDGEIHKGTTIRRPRGTGEVRVEVLERGFRPWSRVVSLAQDVEVEVRLEPAGERPARDGGDARGGTGLPIWVNDE